MFFNLPGIQLEKSCCYSQAQWILYLIETLSEKHVHLFNIWPMSSYFLLGQILCKVELQPILFFSFEYYWDLHHVCNYFFVSLLGRFHLTSCLRSWGNPRFCNSQQEHFTLWNPAHVWFLFTFLWFPLIFCWSFRYKVIDKNWLRLLTK